MGGSAQREADQRWLQRQQWCSKPHDPQGNNSDRAGPERGRRIQRAQDPDPGSSAHEPVMHEPAMEELDEGLLQRACVLADAAAVFEVPAGAAGSQSGARACRPGGVWHNGVGPQSPRFYVFRGWIEISVGRSAELCQR
jgi:hypothetical protein